MSEPVSPRCRLPVPYPSSPLEQTMLVLLRRMAIHGLHDAGATMVAIDRFGTGFRKPLVLLRCFLLELATASKRSIAIAPCCAPRMTRDEALMIEAIGNPALDLLAALTDADNVGRAMSAAHALRHELHARAVAR